eukprot:gene7520-15396_t
MFNGENHADAELLSVSSLFALELSDYQPKLKECKQDQAQPSTVSTGKHHKFNFGVLYLIFFVSSLARQVQIPDYKSMSKSQLFKKLKEQFDFERLQRANSRNSLGKRSSSENDDTVESVSSNYPKNKKIKMNKEVNKIDPIMFAPLSKYTFRFVRSNGTCVLFNVESLVDYLLATGDFTDPETRIPFSDSDLKTIDRLAIKAGLHKASVYQAKKNPQQFTEQRFRRDALQDGSMADLIDMLHKEEVGMTVDRSLSGAPTDVQSFEIHLSSEFKLRYNKIYNSISKAPTVQEVLQSGRLYRGRKFQSAIKSTGPNARALKARTDLTNYLQEFIENNFTKSELRRVIKEPSYIERILHIPPLLVDIKLPKKIMER